MLPSSKPPQDHRSTPEKEGLPHIIPAIIAIIILVGAIIYFDRYASALEDEYIHALVPLQLPQAMYGSVLQQAALRQPDLLPVFGSSEMLSEPSSTQHPSNLFATYPTGFEIINLSTFGENPLDVAQDLVAMGPELRNRKVVISFTPGLFNRTAVGTDEYSGNFSRMHAYALVFSANLSMTLKQRIAQRMLDYPITLRHDMVLTLAVRSLAKGGLTGHLKYFLIYPLGQLEALIIRVQDHYEILNYIWTHPDIKPGYPYKSKPIDWDALQVQAEAEQQAATGNNPYGFEINVKADSNDQGLDIQPAGSADQDYLSQIGNSKEWGDLELILEVFREVGAKPMILSNPINGPLYAAAGISPKAQQVYYTKLEKLVNRYHFPLADFKDYTDDKLFTIDSSSHTSRKGWVIIDRKLDAFYHDNVR